MPKKSYPGGFRLALATARALAVQEFGTCRGLKQVELRDSEGFYEMLLGNLEIEIGPDRRGSGCILIAATMRPRLECIWQLHDRDTLKRNYKEEDARKQRIRRKELEDWVSEGGPEPCHKLIDDIWNKR